MKLWKKLSLLTVLTTLFATAAFGSVIVWQTANYNIDQTISNYQKQLMSTVHAMEQEIRNHAQEFSGEEVRRSYLQYTLRKYGGTDYMLADDSGIVCNLTMYDLTENADRSKWMDRQADYLIQNTEGQYILIMWKNFTWKGKDHFQVLLIRNISYLYEDIVQQIFLLFVTYLVVIFLAVQIIFWVTRRLFRPLNELELTASSISEGDYSRRVGVQSKDEVGKVAEAFNKMASQVEQQVEELEEVSERRRQLLGSLTHELKTPMTSIIGYSDTLLRVKISEEQQKKALEHINSECRRLERLSGKMMNLIGLYNNDSISLKPYSVCKLLDRVLDLESYHTKEHGMQLKYSCSMDEIFMDIDLMESLLVNLVDNAIKASKAGDTIEILAENDRITVQDYGKGIPENEIPKITEAFYMIDKSRSKKTGGIGLGLALCRQIAILHNAHLEIQSETGKGTRISVVFDVH